MRKPTALLAVAAAMIFATAAHAESWNSNEFGSQFHSDVPLSALARPASWLNASRIHVATSFSVGSGFGGSEALQVTSLSYQFKSPMWLNVSMGNNWGTSSASRGGAPFLEGLDFGFHPIANMTVSVQYRDFRSPLQYGSFGNPYTSWGR